LGAAACQIGKPKLGWRRSTRTPVAGAWTGAATDRRTRKIRIFSLSGLAFPDRKAKIINLDLQHKAFSHDSGMSRMQRHPRKHN
jgi:hypothetical protein